MAFIKCPECGKEVSDSSIFCNNCGRSLLETVADVTSEQGFSEQISAKSDNDAKKGRKKNLYCTNCGAVLSSFKRCDNCGIRAYNKAQKYCRYCGREMTGSSKKCQFCGRNSKGSIIIRILSIIFAIISISLITNNVKAMITYNNVTVRSITFIAVLAISIIIVMFYKRIGFICRFCKKSIVITSSLITGIIVIFVLLFSSVVVGPNLLPEGSFFDDARWGMSVEEVRQNTNRRIPKEATYINEETGEADYVAIAYDLPYAKGKQGSVTYTFDKNNKLIKVKYYIMSPGVATYSMTKTGLEINGWRLMEESLLDNKYTLEDNMVELGSSTKYGMYVSYEPKK